MLPALGMTVQPQALLGPGRGLRSALRGQLKLFLFLGPWGLSSWLKEEMLYRNFPATDACSKGVDSDLRGGVGGTGVEALADKQ